MMLVVILVEPVGLELSMPIKALEILFAQVSLANHSFANSFSEGV
jgi:hypothetical protein